MIQIRNSPPPPPRHRKIYSNQTSIEMLPNRETTEVDGCFENCQSRKHYTDLPIKLYRGSLELYKVNCSKKYPGARLMVHFVFLSG